MEDMLWISAVVMVGASLIGLNVWDRRYVKRMSPEDRAQQDADEEREMNNW